MASRLVIGSLNYSSWSTRAWLALTHAGIAFKVHRIGLFVDDNWQDKLLQFSGAAKVPVLIDGSLSVHESLAIGEYAAELAPQANLWPQERSVRARARAVSMEMATSFPALRKELPMNSRARAKNFSLSAAVKKEVERVEQIWQASLATSEGPFLFGEFGLADCMFAPVCSRFRTYGVHLSEASQRYLQAIWQQPTVKKWQALCPDEPAIPRYDVGFE